MPGLGQVALGWFITPGPDKSQIIAHNGGTNGHFTYAGFCTEPRVGVTVLCNTRCPAANDMLGGLGVRLLHELIKAHQ